MAKQKKKLGSLIVIAVLTVVMLVANYFINSYKGIIDQYLGDNFIPSRVLNPEEGDAVVQSVAEEGFVLLKNEGNTLPLKDVKKINLFGWGSTDNGLLMCGGGSGDFTMKGFDGVQKDCVELIEAMETLETLHSEDHDCKGDCSFEINRELVDFYEDYCTVNRNGGTDSRPGWFNYGADPKYFNLVEPNIDSYPDSLLSSAEAFSDTAMVVITRTGGESLDLPKYQRKYIPKSGSPASATAGTVTTDDTRHYLELSTEEEGLLEYVKRAYENVIVILNVSAPIESGFLDDEAIDAAINIGTPGQSGTVSLANILRGNVTPSGKLIDTFAYDVTTAASYANSPNANTADSSTGAKTYTNRTNAYYMDYAEGIYVGYKWYETADAMGYWDNKGGYEKIVQYPFGFGLSYTDFSWTLKSVTPADLSTISDKTEIEIKIDVRNVGDVKGQDVVQIYYEPPYTSGGIEKSSANLVAFAKTELLQPDQVQTLTLKFTGDDMKSYDYNDANENGFTGYELEKGDYKIKLSTDCHNVKQDIGGFTETDGVITYKVASTIEIETDKVTGNVVENRFTGDTANGAIADGVSIDGTNTNANIEYLTRANFTGTFPQESTERRAMDSKIRTSPWNTTKNDTDVMPTQGKDSGLRLVDNLGAKDASYNEDLIQYFGDPDNYDIDDPQWVELLDQMSITELQNVVLKGGYATWEIPSVGKPRITDLDGPTGFNLHPNGSPQFTGFPGEIVVGATWNTNVAKYYGMVVGTEGTANSLGGWYAPGVNIHRSPFCGRNYEYFSEDPYLSGMMGASVVEGTLETGVYSYIKHFAANETEFKREGLFTWMTEQALRETYLKSFEICIKVGKANAVMSSFNRIGDTWSGGSYALMTEVLRDEWGFKGAAVTDYVDYGNSYMVVDQGIRAGNDIWLENGNDGQLGSYGYNDTTSATSITCARKAAMHVIYMYCNTLKIKMDAAGGELGEVIQANTSTSTWVYVWIATDVVIALGLVAWTVAVLKPAKVKKPKTPKTKK